MTARAAWPAVAGRIALAAALGLASVVGTAPLGAQRVPPPPPSRADELLAVGRLALAERELYAAVAAEPREPAHRGALGRYLASRGQFRIAEVLLLEALRFGADTASVARALAAMESYRPRSERLPIPGVRPPSAIRARAAARAGTAGEEVLEGTSVTVPITFAARSEGGALGRVAALAGPGRDTVWVTLDPSREGIAVSSAADTTLEVTIFGGRGPGSPVILRELWIGDRRLSSVDAYVDQDVPRGEVRIGIDVLWRWRAIVDERSGQPTLTLPAAGERLLVPPGAFYLPVMLRFPGLLLVPQPGIEPFPLASARGRLYLSGARWQIDPATSTLVVLR